MFVRVPSASALHVLASVAVGWTACEGASGLWPVSG